MCFSLLSTNSHCTCMVRLNDPSHVSNSHLRLMRLTLKCASLLQPVHWRFRWTVWKTITCSDEILELETQRSS